jgi:hypothetical protein
MDNFTLKDHGIVVTALGILGMVLVATVVGALSLVVLPLVTFCQVLVNYVWTVWKIVSDNWS